MQQKWKRPVRLCTTRLSRFPFKLLFFALSPSHLLFSSLQSDGDNKDDILKVFRLFDDDDSGAITLNDLLRVARELGETMTQAELKEMIDRADLDGDGVISPEEFINIVKEHTNTQARTGRDANARCFCAVPVRWPAAITLSVSHTPCFSAVCAPSITDDQEDLRLNARTPPLAAVLSSPLFCSVASRVLLLSLSL